MTTLNGIQDYITDLLPLPNGNSLFPVNNSITDLFPPSTTDDVAGFLTNLYDTKQSLQVIVSRLAGNSPKTPTKDLGYEKYLQFGNPQVASLANSIVNPSDDDTTKMQKIQNWVINNITYKSDDINYGQGEYWALPTETISKRSGDCEDGAFLIVSLGLNSGVDPSKLRMYGGYVVAGPNAQYGGHGWAAYKRDDGEWVPLDWCYYAPDPETTTIAQLTPLKDDMNYIDDMFYVTKDGTVDATYTNYIRNPEMGARMSPEYSKGWNVNVYA